MRRKDREVKDFNEIRKIIDECEVIRLGLADGEYPYIVPVNFAYVVEHGQITFYIHGAMAGRKYDLMKNSKKCSFEMDVPLRLDCNEEKKSVTMRYKSLMGTANILFLEDKEKEDAVDKILMARYEQTKNFAYDKSVLPHTMVAKLQVTELSAKINPIQTLEEKIKKI